MNKMSRAYAKSLEQRIAELEKDRDSWKRRARYLEAKDRSEPTIILRHQYTRQETS